MFDAGFLEILVVAVIALLIVGPERLPGLARKAGGLIAKVRAFVSTTKADIEKEFNTQEVREALARQEEEIRNLQVMVREKEDKVHHDITNTINSPHIEDEFSTKNHKK